MNIFKMTQMERRREKMDNSEIYKKFCKDLDDIIDFVDIFEDINYCRTFFIFELVSYNPSSILYSAARTLESIKLCVSYTHISDAYILLRRFKEDLFFYIFIILSNQTNNLVFDKSKNKEEHLLKKWLRGKFPEIIFNRDIIQEIGNHKDLKHKIIEYNLEDVLFKIDKDLNNYVHWNSTDFYNKRLSNIDINIEKEITDLQEKLNLLVTIFIFLIILINPALVSSSDYSDYFEMGMTPPEGAQYYVAPFILDFLKKNSHLLDQEAYEYIKNISVMAF